MFVIALCSIRSWLVLMIIFISVIIIGNIFIIIINTMLNIILIKTIIKLIIMIIIMKKTTFIKIILRPGYIDRTRTRNFDFH